MNSVAAREIHAARPVWLMNAAVLPAAGLGQILTDWQGAETGDLNGDTSDIIWYTSTFGVVAVWFMSGGQIAGSEGIAFMTSGWTSTNAD
jgi:hypothetical protein